jgi:hypothetical protein
VTKGILGAIGAILVGLAIFIGQDLYTSWRDSAKHAVEIGRQDKFFSAEAGLFRGFLNNKELYDKSDISISYFTIRNVGSEPLQDQIIKFHFDSLGPFDGFLAAGKVTSPGKIDPEAKIKIKPDDLQLMYPLLNPGESQKIWIAFSSVFQPDVVARSPNLNVSVKQAKETEFQNSEPSFWELFYQFLFYPAIAFIAGALFVGLNYDAQLRKKGIDPKSIFEAEKD